MSQMEWLLSALVVSVSLWAVYRINVFWRRQGRLDISHAIHSALVMLENGGWLSIRERGSQIALKVIRERGSSTAATLNLQIPREPWALSAEVKLRELCRSHDFDCTFPATGDGPLCEIRLAVADIWSDSAGATGGRLVNLVLDALGAQQEARFKIDLVGRRSRRLFDRERALLRDEQ